MAREQGRPFFHNVNCYDPHRPFIGINGPNDLAGGEPPSRWIKPDEIAVVPGFLENLPEIRRELAGYYTNVRRLDDALGAVLAVLKEEGLADSTLVMLYAGDHGITADLEAMKRGGLGGVYMFDCAVGMPDGPARFLQPQWLALMDHTLNETKRLGLQFGVHNCDGFSQSGGPWVTSETSMKQLPGP
jgi:hypothetical protein